MAAVLYIIYCNNFLTLWLCQINCYTLSGPDGLSDTNLSIIVFCRHTAALLAICGGNPTLTGGFPHKGTLMRKAFCVMVVYKMPMVAVSKHSVSHAHIIMATYKQGFYDVTEPPWRIKAMATQMWNSLFRLMARKTTQLHITYLMWGKSAPTEASNEEHVSMSSWNCIYIYNPMKPSKSWPNKPVITLPFLLTCHHSRTTHSASLARLEATGCRHGTNATIYMQTRAPF